MLIGNVSRVLDYFTSRHSDIELKEISLVGLGAACLGLDQLLGNELGIPVKVPGKASGWGSTGDVYYALMGATIKPLKFVLEKEEKEDSGRRRVVAHAGSCGFSLCRSCSDSLRGGTSDECFYCCFEPFHEKTD